MLKLSYRFQTFRDYSFSSKALYNQHQNVSMLSLNIMIFIVIAHFFRQRPTGFNFNHLISRASLYKCCHSYFNSFLVDKKVSSQIKREREFRKLGDGRKQGGKTVLGANDLLLGNKVYFSKQFQAQMIYCLEIMFTSIHLGSTC